MMNKLSVRLYGMPVGVLERNEQGKMHFAYLQDAKNAISQAMPLKEKTFDHKNCKAYFGGLIPENEIIKEALAKHYDFNPRDLFSFLMHVGKDCVGAISFHAISEPNVLDSDIVFKTEVKEEHPVLLPGEDQQKAICLIEDKIVFPMRPSFSTHIMKMNQDEEVIYNIYFCLKMARYAGLLVPEFCLKNYLRHPVLIVKRTDRVMEERHVRRLHQEDVCQALGIGANRKYEYDKGPGFLELFDLLKVTCVPAYARSYLVKAVLFNTAINYTQAHAKHFSLVAKMPNRWEVAPFTHFYCNENLEQPLAMAIGNAKSRGELEEKDWKIFCEQIKYTFPIFQGIKKKYAQCLQKAAVQAQEDFKKEALDTKIAKKWVNFIRTRLN